MSDYTLEHHRSPNQSSRQHYGHDSDPTGITFHHWGSTGQKHANVVNYLSRSGGNTSAHLVCSAGLVTRLVDDDRAAWHSGSTAGNGSTIGIECRPELSDGDWDTLVELCADLEEEHGSLKYYKHSDWKNTACPGKYADRIGDLVEAVNAEHDRRKSGGSKPAPKPPEHTPTPSKKAPPYPLDSDEYFGPKSGPDESVSGYYSHREDLRTWQTQMVELRRWRGLGKIDGLYGPKTSTVTRKFQHEKGLKVDGLIGPKTWAAAWEEPIT